MGRLMGLVLALAAVDVTAGRLWAQGAEGEAARFRILVPEEAVVYAGSGR